MIIQIQKFEYKIEREKLSRELSKIFHRNLSNTPGISKDRFISWETSKWETYFFNYINYLLEILTDYKETHTDTLINLTNFLQNDILPQISNFQKLFNLEQAIDLLKINNNGFSSLTEKVIVLREYSCFTFALTTELLVNFSLATRDQSFLNIIDPIKGEGDKNLFLKQFDFYIPASRRRYSEIHFRFIGKHIQRFDYSSSIEIHKDFKFNLNQLIDAVFIDSSNLQKKDKQHLKTWFHNNGKAPKKIEPMLLDDLDSAIYIAYFLKAIGASPGEKSQIVLKKVERINDWLNNNFLRKVEYLENGTKIPICNFKDLSNLIKLNGRETGVNQIDKQLKEYFKVSKKA
jgi:hypothetical protein